MINILGQVMLYVTNQNEAVKFWTEKVGFVVKLDQNNGQMRWIEIAPGNDVETTIVLHDKELISKMQPELNLGTPSLMFFSENLDKLYSELVSKNVNVGEIVKMPSGRVFNFSDSENNYYAVMERINK
jgi:lactoylglutathione lyase